MPEQPTAVIVVSDTHINSTVALSRPTIQLDDGGTYRASRIQRALWDTWLQFAQDVNNLTAGMRRILVLNGDIGELDTKRRSNQLITVNKATVLRMAVDTFEPVMELADGVLVTRGTMAHVGKASWLEEELARDLDGIVIRSDKEVYSHYHARPVIAGVRFDIAHHGRMGGMRHTAKTYAVRLAQDVMDKYRDMDEAPPHVVIRSHNHRRADSGRNWPTFAMFTPAWQMLTEFAYRIGAENSLADIGGDVFICDAGRYTWHPFEYRPQKGRKVWALKI